MIGDRLAAKVQVDGSLSSLCILKIKSIKDKSSKKYETVINGIAVGEKVFTGKVMEGKISDDYVTVNISTNIHQEIKVDGEHGNVHKDAAVKIENL